MPRRSVLSLTEIQNITTFPEADFSLIRQHRGDSQKFGFAFLLCAMRYPGIIAEPFQSIPSGLGLYLEHQLGISSAIWKDYIKRPATRREHLLELQKILGVRSFTDADYSKFLEEITKVALQTDKAFAVAEFFVETLRSEKILLPSGGTIDRICSEAIFQAKQQIYKRLTENLTEEQLLSTL
jgi:hypothetical protein